VHHEPPIRFALSAVAFLCPVFVGIAGFLKSCSRTQASLVEVWARDFLL